MTALPKITVIIPTRERGDVLGAALATVTAQDYPELTILVSDNFSGDGTRAIVDANPDPRIRYINTGKRVSMSHNWEFALGHVEDGWVMVIGDDDGLLPGALRRIAALIATHKVRAINASYVTYIWPNDLNAGSGRLLVPMARGVERRDSAQWLRRAIMGETWYSELPMLYCSGVVEMALLREIRDRTGTFFHSCQPDIFSAVALATTTGDYLWSREPLAIAGHSKHSNGASWTASTGKQDAHGQSDPNKIFMSEGIIPFHPDATPLDDGNLPFNIDILVYESYLQSQFLRGDWLDLQPRGQMAQFLAREDGDDLRMEQWSRRYSERHNLDPAAVASRIGRERWRLRRHRLRYHIEALAGSYRIEPSAGIVMRDVYEASLVADTVLRTRPPMWRSYVSTLRKRLGRGKAA